MNPILLAKARREAIRWHLLQIAHVSRPQGMHTERMLPIIQTVYPDATHDELRRELDYLKDRKLMTIKSDPLHQWFVDLTHYGVDIVEYTSECFPGIARPLNPAG